MNLDYKKAILLDLKKAFDTVNREELKNQIKIFSQNEVITEKLLLLIVDLYDKINYNICENIIEPNRGIPQGSVFGPLLFIIYINNMLLEAKNECPNTIAEAFIDDIIILGKDINSLQKAYRFFKSRIKGLKMELNVNKCELL